MLLETRRGSYHGGVLLIFGSLKVRGVEKGIQSLPNHLVLSLLFLFPFS